MPDWLIELSPIVVLLAVIALVVARLPRVEGLGHTSAYRRRRVMNWLPLGLTYAFLYWGRYNLNVAATALSGDAAIDIADFNWIFGAGTAVYGFSFLINGPLTDRFGGRFSILTGATGAAVVNLVMGVCARMAMAGQIDNLFWYLLFLYPINMYFQSFGAVAIVKVNAPWFHVRERGVFGAIFGILISLGIYFAFDWSGFIVERLPAPWVFFAPSIALFVALAVTFVVVKNRPGDAGQEDFNTGDASSGDEEGERSGAVAVFKLMLKNRIVMTIASIEFCSGFLRQAIMQLYRLFAKSIGTTDSYVLENWGLLLCCAGILGGTIAGIISDHVFQSRRGPVAAVLYGAMLVGSIAMVTVLGSPVLGGLVIVMSMCVIGVHGMLSGTASMDFGGTKNVGIAVGIIDGFVYGGTAAQAILYANILPEGGPEAADVSNWTGWPIAMIPVAVVGLVLASRVWNAKPKPRVAS